MRRGEVWWVNFEPSVGGEIRKVRPAIIVSNDMANASLNRIQIVPTSSRIERVYASETLVTVGGKRSKAAADQITTAAKERLLRRIGEISVDDMSNVERVIKIQLGLGN